MQQATTRTLSSLHHREHCPQSPFPALSLSPSPPTWPQCRPIEFGPTSADAASPAFPQPKTGPANQAPRLRPKHFPSPNLQTKNLFPLGLILSAHRNCSSLFPFVTSSQLTVFLSLLPLLTPKHRQNVHPRLLRHCQAGQRRMRSFPRRFCCLCFYFLAAVPALLYPLGYIAPGDSFQLLRRQRLSRLTDDDD